MPKKILLIENDAAFASELTRALEERGLETRLTGDGKEGLDLARDQHPDAIVLCVELPRMSGYSVCQKLRKDDTLKGIPLVLTSAEATEETFEAHRKLKARADEYLIKPFAPEALIDKLAGLVELPEPPAEGEELVTLDDVEELSGEIPLIPAGERVRPSDVLPDQDDDLKLLDDAFATIAGEPPEAAPAPSPRAAALPLPDEKGLGDEIPMAREELRAVADLLPAGDEVATHVEIDKLGEEADAALAALGTEVGTAPADLARAEALLDEPPAEPRAARAEPLRPAGPPPIRARPPATPPPYPAAVGPGEAGKDAEIQRLQDRISELLIDLARAREGGGTEDRIRDLEGDIATRTEEARREAEGRRQAEDRARRAEESLRQAEEGQLAAEEALAKAEQDARAVEDALRAAEEAQQAAEEQATRAGERAGVLEAEVASLRLRAEETEQTASLKAAELAEALAQHDSLGQKLDLLEAELTETHRTHAGELDALRAELESARAAVEGTQGETERRTGELTRRIAELEAVNAKHEERVVKAYQKIKTDEKIREKTRKALAIALQLLDERIGTAPAKDPADPAPRRE